jgi:hypothetical protein
VTVKELMERVNMNQTGLALAYIKDGLEEIEMLIGENIKTGTSADARISASTLAFTDNNPDTITDSNSGFVDAGFVAGMKIVVSGSTSNNGTYTVDTVAAGTLTLSTDDSLTVEAAGEDVIVAGAIPTKYDIVTNKRYYEIPTDALKIVDIKIKGHLNDNSEYRSIPRLLDKPRVQDADEV